MRKTSAREDEDGRAVVRERKELVEREEKGWEVGWEQERRLSVYNCQIARAGKTGKSAKSV